MLSSRFLSKPLILLGHRGSPRIKPENTIPSFLSAIHSGADGIELDIRLSQDHEAVVFHDAGLYRMTGFFGSLSRKTSDTLKKIEMKNTEITIPTLEEVFLALGRKVKYFVEIKAENLSPREGHILSARALELVQKYELVEEVIFVSFDSWIVKWIKRKGKHFQTGLNFSHPRMLIDPRRHRFSYLDALCFNHKVLSPKLVREARSHQLSILTWVVNDPAALKRVRAFEVDGIISDIPHKLIKHMSS